MATPVPPVTQVIKLLRQPVKIKVEVQEEDEELTIPCRLCNKTFCNEVALRNHLRMEHSGEQVDMDQWVQEAMEQRQKQQASYVPQQEVGQNSMPIIQSIQSIQPADLLRLASEDISYIIIKAEDDSEQDVEKVRIRKRKAAPAVKPNREVSSPRENQKRAREIVPITGPFECLQPSTLVADGQCHQIFFSCCDYSIHFRDEHTRRRKAIKCQVCEKVLASSIGEEATSPYPCHVCAHGCNSRDELTEHINTAHVKLKPYQCSVCHKRFTQQGGVHQHMRMHTGDRPFHCTYCDKAFTQKSGLDQHLRTHTKVKPYRCVICSKTFIQSVHLKQHMRTHTNVAPFQCIICEKRFKQSSHLNYHLKNHNEANMTDDQKKKYKELIGIINAQQNYAVRSEVQSESESEVRVEQAEVVEGEVEQAEVVEQECEEQVMYTDEDGNEVVLQEDREYILSDNGNETWSVKVVE